MTSVEVVCGTLWSTVKVTSVVRLAAEQVDAAQLEVGALARALTTWISCRTSLPPALIT
jgi:hypothetical protein